MAGLREFREQISLQGMLVRATALLCAALIVPSVVFADVIYLKNGQKITAHVTKENEKQVFYEIDGGDFAVPKSLVDHIAKSKEPAPTSQQEPARPTRDVPLPITPPVEGSSDGPMVVHEDAIDEALLTQLTDDAVHTPSAENLSRLRQGFQSAAVFLTHKGDPEGAIVRYREALKYLPHDSALTLALGYLLWSQEHYLEAVDLLLPEADRHPQSPNFPGLLGSAYYGMENLDHAIAEWSKALAMQPDNAPLRDAITRAQHEREVSGDYSELRSDHFLLRYDGQRDENLSGVILNSLKGSFQDLVLDLDYAPSETIVVLLYPNQDFRDITRTPNWVGALNDGKIRMPVSGLTQMTPDLARVLKHELTHSFVRQIALGHCPVWFNEGLAQLEDGSTTAALGSQLGRAMVAGKVPAYPALEGSFVSLPADQAILAYAKSLAALEYLRDTFGMGEVRRMLRHMATADVTTVLQDEVRLSYSAFEDEVASYVLKKYGS